MKVQPLGSALGGVVTELDLSRELGPSERETLNEAFARYQLLYFPDQTLTPDCLKRIAGVFGTVAQYPFAANLDGHPGVTEVVKSEEDTVNFGGVWHSDTTYTPNPPIASLLYSRVLPETGGDTLFANMYMAWDQLSPGMQRMLRELKGVSTSALRSATGTNMRGKYRRSMKVDYTEGNDLVATHPVARVHPVTGKTALYVNSAHTKSFDGMSEAESQPILEFLFEHLKAPEFTTRLQWNPNAVAVWDNRCTQHYALNDYHGQRRVMHRVTIEA